MAKKRKQASIEEDFNRIFEGAINRDQAKRCYYELRTHYIKDAMDRYPKCIYIRIINAFVQKYKLNNEFKAIFEMMKSELCGPTKYE